MTRGSRFHQGLAAAAVAIALAIGASAAEKFRILPKDVSLQPLTPKDTGKIEFVGAKTFTPAQLREPLAEQIREIDERGLTKPRADDTAYYLAVYYRKQGFPEVEVNYEIRGPWLVLRIDEGVRSHVRNVRFTGNHAMTEATLFEYLIGGTKERLMKEPTAVPFVRADIQTGVARIRGLYESEGYLDAVVDDAKFDFTKDHARVDVQVGIKEGQRYTFGELSFEGNTIFPREELVKSLVDLDKGYTAQRVNAMQRNLQFFYKAHGYYEAQVDVTSDPKQAVRGRVPVSFKVTPHKLFRFNGVTVRGTDRLREDFLPKRFASLHGQTYDPTKLDEKYRELLRTGLFKNLRLESVAQPDGTIRLDLTVEEAKAKEVGFSIGGGSYEGLTLGLHLEDRNLGGNGRPLSFNLDLSQRATRGELLYVDPWFFESDYHLRARLYAQSRDEEGYSKFETGARADLSRKVTKHIELSLFAQIEDVEITEALIEPQFLGATSYQIATIGLTQSFDFRDNPINPSRGWVVNTALDFDALAGDLAFGRATLRVSYYLPIGQKMLLALGARGGVIYPLTSVPIDERFFNGGSTTVRSFKKRDLGPKDRHGYPIGGEAYTVLNAELTFPIVGALQGAAFVDAGNLMASFKEAGFNDMRYAIGLGLRYKLPIGPLRLDYGVNPSRREGEDFGAFHFSFGFAF